MIPFDLVPPRFDEACDRPREDADADPPELLRDDPALVDFEDVPELDFLEVEPDFPDVDRDVELEPLLLEDDDADLDPDLVDLDAVPLFAADDFDLDAPPDVDFELPDAPAKRRPFFDFAEQWRRDHHPKDPPIRDEGQRYLMIELI